MDIMEMDLVTTILPPVLGHAGLFSLGMATGVREWNLRIQTCYILLKNGLESYFACTEGLGIYSGSQNRCNPLIW